MQEQGLRLNLSGLLRKKDKVGEKEGEFVYGRP